MTHTIHYSSQDWQHPLLQAVDFLTKELPEKQASVDSWSLRTFVFRVAM